MREQGWGRIVNMASLAGQQGGAVAGAHYAASKAGIVVLTKMVAAELAPHGVTANAVAPAAVRTPVFDEVPPERLEARASASPSAASARPRGRRARRVPCSDEAAYITGATLDANGGLSCADRGTLAAVRMHALGRHRDGVPPTPAGVRRTAAGRVPGAPLARRVMPLRRAPERAGGARAGA